MELVPTDDDWAIAGKTFERFASRPGAKHIATEFALAHLSALLRTMRPDSVLEFGAGIGTITHMLLVHPHGPRRVTSTEDHPFCLEQLEANIPRELRDRLELVTTLAGPERIVGDFELVIFDGEFSDPAGFLYINSGTVCFIEGSRRSTRRALDEVLGARDLVCRFENYNRGTKPLALVWRKSKTMGIPYPKLKRRMVLKGCWVGEVSG